MNPQEPARPGWMTDELEEEWPEQESDQQDAAPIPRYPTCSDNWGTTKSHETASIATRRSGGAGSVDAGRAGTFVVRDELPPAIVFPQTPGRAKNGVIKDMFSPLALEKMFEPPSQPPPDRVSSSSSSPPVPCPTRLQANKPTKPSKLSQVLSASPEKETHSDEILETDVPNMGLFGGYKPSVNCQFTFAVSRHASPEDSSEGDHLHHVFSRPQAESTPLPPSQGHEDGHMTSDARLRLFHFQYDTYTRDHLSAMVDSFGLNTPSGNSSNNNSPIEGALGQTGNIAEDEEKDPDESFSRLRSTKRIKLSSTDTVVAEKRKSSSPHVPVARNYVAESRSLMEQIKRARDFSMVSTASHHQGKGRDTTRHEQAANNHNVKGVPFLQVPEIQLDRPPSSASMLSDSSSNAKSSRYSSLAYRRQAEDLMAKIKSDRAIRRLFSEKTEKSFVSVQEDEPLIDRSYAPSPEVIPNSLLPVSTKWSSEDKENNPDPPPYAPRSSSTGSQKSTKRLHAEDDDIGFPVNGPRNDVVVMSTTAQSLPRVFIQQPRNTERVRSPNKNFLAPPPTAFNSVRFRTATSNGDFDTNDDLNRYVSSSTTATSASGTTLTNGSVGSCVKHPGPPHMVHIGPTDLPEIPERVGLMVYNRDLMRWMKERVPSEDVREVDRPQLSVVLSASEGESEDPFKDIESLRDDDSGGSAAHQAQVGQIEDISQDDSDSHSIDMDLDDDETDSSDSDFGDRDDSQLTTFSFDGPRPVVHVLTGEPDRAMDLEASYTTDSDSEREIHAATIEEISEDESEPSLRENNPPSHVESPTRLRNPDLVQMSTPLPSTRTSIHPPRSALKSASVTPIARPPGSAHRRSVSFSDGRKEGKIIGLDIDHTATNSRLVAVSSLLPSARSNRIAELLVQLEEASIDDRSPSKSDQNNAERQINQVATHASVITNDLEGKADQGAISPSTSRRRFSRSKTVRSIGSPATPRTETPQANGNATFLTECSFGVAHDRLVQVLTDVQPFEPHWEELRSIDLSGKRIDSVARLKEFLPKLDTLHLDKNLLCYLSGVPSTVRTLSVSSNALTSLTSFGHLTNLEYLDVSHNDIDSLQQLASLRHLRELRADCNRISSLEGLSKLDNLLRVSVKGNELRELDCDEYEWSRLEVLELSSNHIQRVSGLQKLSALVSLSLENNDLETIDLSNLPTVKERKMPPSNQRYPGLSVLHKLRILRLSGNRLSHLDVSRFPGLRTLYVDNNCLAENIDNERFIGKHVRQRLQNLHRLTKLENFSARNQSGSRGRNSGLHLVGEDIRDVKRLYLSGNPTPFPLNASAQSCYNLVYLELAGCRLTELPSYFSGLVPNLRVLNLNYNFLETADVVQALSGLSRLRKLTLVGGRMAGTAEIIRLLHAIGENIELLDFRMNPFSLGWYLPLLVHEGSLIQPSDAYVPPDSGAADERNFGTGNSVQDLQSKIEHRNQEVVMTTNRMDDGYDMARGSATRSARSDSVPSAPSRMHATTDGNGHPGDNPATQPISSGSGSGQPYQGQRERFVFPSAVNRKHPSSGPSIVSNNVAQPPISQKKAPSRDHRPNWEVLDAHFRLGLPNRQYVGRMCWRGFVMRACPALMSLDGVRVTAKEKRKCEAVLEALGRPAPKKRVEEHNDER